MLVSTIGVVLVVAAGVLIWRLTRDGSAVATPVAGEWDEVVFVDRADGSVTTASADGRQQGTVAATSHTTEVHSQGSRLALVETGQIALTDVGKDAPDIVPTDLGSAVTRLPIADSLWLAVSKTTGGNLILVNGLNGKTYDFAALS
jgi:hypothetical protein